MINKEVISAQKELVVHTFNQAQAYTTVVIAGGYAGFFAIWAFTKDFLTKVTAFSAAALISVSLVSFVIWEVYCMIHRSRSIFGIVKALEKPSDFSSLIIEHQKSEIERSLVFKRAWIVCLVFSVSTALSAFAILFSAFLHGLWIEFHTP